MSFQDKLIQCSDCGATFTFSAEEQEFLRSKGFTNEPKHCPSCHAAMKTKRYGDGDYSYRSRSWLQMFRLNLHQVLGDPNSN
jgi:NAD-dependent SIR2 family protein deacetylase